MVLPVQSSSLVAIPGRSMYRNLARNEFVLIKAKNNQENIRIKMQNLFATIFHNATIPTEKQ